MPQALPADAPVLVLLPGLTGGSGDSYVLHAVASARRAGIRAVVFNSRGTADSPVVTPQFYSASFTGDTRWGQARGVLGEGGVTHSHSCSFYGGQAVGRRGAQMPWTWMRQGLKWRWQGRKGTPDTTPVRLRQTRQPVTQHCAQRLTHIPTRSTTARLSFRLASIPTRSPLLPCRTARWSST